MAAIVIQHDSMENHSTTDEMPSERAGVSLEFGENRWLNLTKLSASQILTSPSFFTVQQHIKVQLVRNKSKNQGSAESQSPNLDP